MRTDPREACGNEHQRLLWALVHDAVAHPLMALAGWPKWALRFHDWTSHKAWPRAQKRERRVIYTTDVMMRALGIERVLRAKRVAFCTTGRPRYLRGEWRYVYEVELLG